MNRAMTEKQLEIHTHEVDLRVLGTKFNFKNYSDDEEVTVNLLEGKVALHNGLKSMPELYLAPNEKMVLNKRTGEMICFYGSFKVMGNTIEEVLETIASTNRMKYRYENEKYILY